MADLRLILDPPAGGPHNMAVDEALLEAAIDRGMATVRMYAWSEPTVSLGYFQRADETHLDPRLNGLPVVRRLSGGGAILHHHEITYSIALPSTHPALFRPLPGASRGPESGAAAGNRRGEQNADTVLSLTPDPSPAMNPQEVGDVLRAGEGSDGGALFPNPSRLYRLAHEAIIQVLKEFIDGAPPAGRRPNRGRMSVRMRGDVADSDPRSSILHPRSSPAPFLCFGRGDPHDVLLGPHKIVGSAQRRRRGAVLQHGSILLRQSPHAPEFPGVHELAEAELPSLRMSEACGPRIAMQLAQDWQDAGLSAAELHRAAELAATRYTENNGNSAA